MKNYSSQLKILSAVKAAGGSKDTGGADQLVSVTRSFGYMVADLLGYCSVAKLKYRIK
jgi:hypothetical protein